MVKVTHMKDVGMNKDVAKPIAQQQAQYFTFASVTKFNRTSILVEPVKMPSMSIDIDLVDQRIEPIKTVGGEGTTVISALV